MTRLSWILRGSLVGALVLGPVAMAASPVHADTGCPSASAGYGGGAGTSGSPYLISEPGHLQRLRDTTADYSKYFLFTTDINMGGCTWSTPIANGATSFTGRLDGGGHVISGLSVSVVNASLGYVGLVGYLGANGVIRDLGFTGDVSYTYSGNGSGAYVAGLVGFTFAPTTIERSYATGNVAVTYTSSNGSVYVVAGGLVGTSQSAVTDSYSRGNVSVSATSTAGAGSAVAMYAGGAVGDFSLGTVTNVYSLGAPSASGSATTVTTRLGGFAGYRDTTYATAVAGQWDTQTSGTASATGQGAATGMTGRTTALMQTAATFSSAGWSITEGYSVSTTWSICGAVNGGYPFLSAFYTANPCLTVDPAQVPPSWYQAVGRASAQDPCEQGWGPSWAEWMNERRGGYVCMREIYYSTRTGNWAIR